MDAAAKKTTIGVEIEFCGITRMQAIIAVREALQGSPVSRDHNLTYDRHFTKDQEGRTWTIMRDGSVSHGDAYSCELVTPILTYEHDIKTLQDVCRSLAKAGGKTALGNNGLHIHVGGDGHTPKTLRNWVNLWSQRQDLIYKAIQFKPSRLQWCHKLPESLVEEVNDKKPQTMSEIEDVWYKLAPQHQSRTAHYNSSRYHVLNLHSYFNMDHHTVEVRCFNSTLHAGKVRAYIALVIAMNNMALKAKSINPAPVYSGNDKFAMRTWLNRLGFIGDEWVNPRKHLTEALEGCAAWRFGA